MFKIFTKNSLRNSSQDGNLYIDTFSGYIKSVSLLE